MQWVIRARNGTCRRKNLRIELAPPLPIVLRNDWGEFPGEIHDISLGGARLISSSFRRRSGRFNVTHDEAGEIPADVKWCVGDIIGVSFERGPPAVALLTRCLRRLLPGDRPHH